MVRRGSYRFPFVAASNIEQRPAPFHLEHRYLRHCVDFAMPEGTPVLAAREGVITDCCMKFAENFRDPEHGLGRENRIVIRHDDGQESVYVHLQHGSARSHVGKRVAAGDVIALSGQTGYATYPHLHFGVYDVLGCNIRIQWL